MHSDDWQDMFRKNGRPESKPAPLSKENRAAMEIAAAKQVVQDYAESMDTACGRAAELLTQIKPLQETGPPLPELGEAVMRLQQLTQIHVNAKASAKLTKQLEKEDSPEAQALAGRLFQRFTLAIEQGSVFLETTAEHLEALQKISGLSGQQAKELAALSEPLESAAGLFRVESTQLRSNFYATLDSLARAPLGR